MVIASPPSCSGWPGVWRLAGPGLRTPSLPLAQQVFYGRRLRTWHTRPMATADDDKISSPARVLRTPPKVRPADRVAVVSPSTACPGMFPAVHEIGMRVLRDDLGLEPVEYPTTRQVGATPQARARDLMAAFADPSIRAVLATIGGDDQITVLPFLDPEVVQADPKPFAGYSDNTNLLNWLWNLGIVGYHGGSTMVHLARPGGTHPVSVDRRAWLDLAQRRPGGHRADLGRQPGDPALESGCRSLDPTGRRLRGLRALAGDLRRDASGGGGLQNAAQRWRARASGAVPGHRCRQAEGMEYRVAPDRARTR